MTWYYRSSETTVGPVERDDLLRAASEGIVGPDTLVWSPGMSQWSTYAAAIRSAEIADTRCSVCRREVTESDHVAFRGVKICSACKAIHFQKVREGGEKALNARFGGFWARAVATAVDTCITATTGIVIGLPLAYIAAQFEGNAPTLILQGLTALFGITLNAGYDTWFVGRFAATPGKMAVGLTIVRADGAKLTYMRAFARHFAEWISSAILLVGYMMAAFDEEKRALHDRICDTRVIRAGSMKNPEGAGEAGGSR